MPGQPRPLTVQLEIAERNPPTGSLHAGGGAPRRFGGWLELIGLLEAVLADDQRCGTAADSNPIPARAGVHP